MDSDQEIPIQMEAVLGSTMIDSMGYDGSGILIVQFKNGSQYRWDGIPPSVYQALRAAPSVGKALHALEKDFGVGTQIG